jgi:hypothetical protein
MALTSPGVEVTVIDESFYTPAEPGTVPLIVVATAENKLNGAGTAVASGTLAANAGKVFRVTSQRELVELYGVPFFEQTASSTPVHGGERNEYGLLAAYSLLGVSNSAFILRADVDLNELAPSTDAPGATPANGTWWVDTQASAFGIQEWNSNLASVAGGQKFAAKIPLVLTDDEISQIENNAPKASVGTIGDYCVVWQTVDGDGSFGAEEELARYYFKSPGNTAYGVDPGQWVLVGSNDWAASWPAASSSAAITTLTQGDQFTINGTTITVPSGTTVADRLEALKDAINTGGVTGVTASVSRSRLFLYSDGATDSAGDSSLSGAIVLANATNTPLTDLKITVGTYLAPQVEHAPHTLRPTWKRSENSSTVQGFPTGSVWVKTTEPNSGARIRVKRWNNDTSTWVAVEAPMYANGHDALYNLDRAGGGLNVSLDAVFTQYNAREYTGTPSLSPTESGETAELRMWVRAATGATTIVSDVVDSSSYTAGTKTFFLAQSIPGSNVMSAETTVEFDASASAGDADAMAAAINAATFVDVDGDAITNNVVASVTADNQVTISHTKGGEIRLREGTGSPLNNIFTVFSVDTGLGTANLYDLNSSVSSLVLGSPSDTYLASNWKPMAALNFYAKNDAPLDEPADGQLWYNPSFAEVDVMYHNGNTWVGYRHSTAFPNTDPNGPLVRASMPTEQSDASALVDGDLWISTADLENFPTIYKYDTNAGDTIVDRWVLIDKTDQTTEDGVLFADARFGSSGATGDVAAPIKTLLTSNYLDPDAPDPALYPKGMLLWNLRRSGGNVKRFSNSYIDTNSDNARYDAVNSDNGDAWVSGESMSAYATDRWVTASPNNEDGSGSFGRKAQRSLVVQRLKSVVDTSLEARDEERRNFNLIAAPGYPELLSNLINLNIDRRVTAFVIGDTPLRLQPDATSLSNWGSNAAGALDNGDQGIVTYDEYCAVYYPNGFTTDLSGANAVVPASHMMLRTMTLSDQVSYPWFAPAGTRRGGISNATAVGYIDADTGEFTSVSLNTGQRDTLYELKINPIPFFVGVGLVAYGQKTRARNASALDRINVARLVVYLRNQLSKLARPYIFEPNDRVTRDEIKGAVESLLIELVGLRAIYDFAVVCDESNNTPARIDRNELYVDVAIEPTKAVEFIYIPLRLKNTGEI